MQVCIDINFHCVCVLEAQFLNCVMSISEKFPYCSPLAVLICTTTNRESAYGFVSVLDLDILIV